MNLEYVDNEQRTLCTLILDTSGSMEGEPIIALNNGLHTLCREVQADPVAQARLELCITTFGDGGVQTTGIVSARDFQPPTLTAGGRTPMGTAINQALDQIESRKQEYKTNGIDYTRPWSLLITDGFPTDDIQSAIERVHQEEATRKIAFFAVGVQGADMELLARIATPERPPLKLDGLKFNELFVWLSASQRRISTQKVGQQTALPPTNGWAINPT